MVASPIMVTKEAESLIAMEASQASFGSPAFIEEVLVAASSTTIMPVSLIRILAAH